MILLIYIAFIHTANPMRRTLQLLLLIALCSSLLHAQPITLTFFVEHEVEIDKDYIEMVVNVKSQETSMKKALEDAAESVAFVRGEVQKFCLANSKKKEECQEISESGKFNVEPEYRTIRGEPVFIDFAVSYEVTAKILHHQADIGPLVDRIGKRAGSTIVSMEWKDAEEEDEEIIAIDKGLIEAQARCKNVGGILGEIESVNEVPNFELQEKEEEGEQEEEEDDGPEIIKYKFVVKCLPKQAKK